MFNPEKDDPMSVVPPPADVENAKQTDVSDTPPGKESGQTAPEPGGDFRIGQPVDFRVGAPEKAVDGGDANRSDAKSENGRDGGAGKDAAKDGEMGAPGEYAPFEMPEGVQVDADLLGAFTAKAGELKLSQEQAQELVAIQAAAQIKQRDGMLRDHDQFIRQQKEMFTRELDADPELGGRFRGRTMERANLALRTYDRGGKLGALLAEWNIESHPEIVRFMESVGRTLEEDYAPKSGAGNREKSTAELFFPDVANTAD